MARSASREDLARGIVSSAPAAARVADAARLLARVLLREDPRVQAVYRAWAFDVFSTDDDRWQGCEHDLAVLAGLVRDLGLGSYRDLEWHEIAHQRSGG